MVRLLHHVSAGDKQYHIACGPRDLAKYLLVPGDPERVVKIASFWEEAREIAFHREFRAYTGKYKGVEISALSSGIGPACMAIVINEVANIGVETLIRVGSSGAIQEKISCGDLIISTGAVRLDATSNCYVPVEYPAVANYEVVLALIEAAETLGVRYHVGITATTSDFYAGQERPVFKNTYKQWRGNLLPILQEANVLNFEMETATLFVLANLFKLRAGTICAVYANRCTNEFKLGAGEIKCIKVANEAVRILNEWDEQKKRKGKQWLFPSLLDKR